MDEVANLFAVAVDRWLTAFRELVCENRDYAAVGASLCLSP
jgi:hypothetical protein